MMIRWFRHPHEIHLAEFAEGTLDPDDRRRVADHLAECMSCRNRVRFIR
ncbi:MAG: zf-HC2 domain-containing protein, partial [Gemmatimonadota bacterium]